MGIPPYYRGADVGVGTWCTCIRRWCHVKRVSTNGTDPQIPFARYCAIEIDQRNLKLNLAVRELPFQVTVPSDRRQQEEPRPQAFRPIT